MRSPTQSTVWREIACDRASKSNIWVSLSVAASAEAIGAIEEIANVSSDRIFQCGETAVVTGALQPIDIGLREVLVAAADFPGHVDIADIRNGAERGIGSEHQ